jgi:pimeloyl-[acyl-carrier protein] methyl ester esterase
MRARLSSLPVPSLWIGGRRDRLVPSAALRWAAQHSPGGEFIEITSGHAPFLSHAQEVAGAIAAFAERIAGR